LGLNIDIAALFKQQERTLEVEILRVTNDGRLFLQFNKEVWPYQDLSFFKNYTMFSFKIVSEYISEKKGKE